MKDVSKEVAQQLAQAYLEFLQKVDEIAMGQKGDTVLNTDTVIEKKDGWIFVVEGARIPKHICVSTNYKVFSPVLVPAAEQRVIEEAPDIESLKQYGLANFNSGIKE